MAARRVKSSGHSPGPRRVLVVRAGALGDTLMITPLIRRLHEDQPNREIDLLCSSGGAALLRGNKYVSRIYTLRNRNLPYLLSAEKRALVKQIRSNGYDFAIVLESAPRYRELLQRAGIGEIRGFLETPFEPAQHSVLNNLRAGGFSVSEGNSLDLDLTLSSVSVEAAARLLRSLPNPKIGIHPGYGPSSKKSGQTDRLRGWKTGNFAQIARELASQGASIVLTGSREDRPICEQIATSLPRDRVCILAGETSIEQLSAVIQNLDLLISVDSGPAHIAAAVGTPLVVLWGPGILNQTGPLSSTTPIQVLNARVPCAPCYGTERMKQCRNNICMEQIHPDSVVAAALFLLKSKMCL